MPHEKPVCRISSDFRTEISGIKSARKICSVCSIFLGVWDMNFYMLNAIGYESIEVLYDFRL